MKADTWMPLYLADYLRATMHLTTEQHGAYMLLIMACWERGGNVPNDARQLAGITRMSLQAWKRIAPVILAFFREDGPNLTQKRVLAERAKAQELSDKRAAVGRTGGRPKKQTESKPKAIGLANGNQNHKQNETPSPTVERASKKALSHSGAEESAGRADGPPPLRLIVGRTDEERERAAWLDAQARAEVALGLCGNPDRSSEIAEFLDVCRERLGLPAEEAA